MGRGGREGHGDRGGRGALTWTGGCRTSLAAVQALAGRPELPRVGTGRSP